MEELIIIGSGPAGLSAAIYASRAMMKPLLIEGIPGGQLMITSEVENYPGFEAGILGPQLMDQFRKQALKFGTRFETGMVTDVKKEGNVINVFVGQKRYQTKSLLVATGADAKWLGLESEKRLMGKGVSACATCDGFFFKDKVVAVVGGGDSAMEESLYLTKFASKVYVIHRKSEFRASKIMQKRVLDNPKIEVVWNAQVVEVLGDQKVEGIRLEVDGSEKELSVDGLFVAIGHNPSTKFLLNSGVLLDEKGYIYTTERVRFEKLKDLMEKFPSNFKYMTNIDGIFASGDCVDSVYRQAGTAVGMGIGAQIEIESYLNR